MNYIYPVAKLTGKYIYKYTYTTNNPKRRSIPILFTFVASDIEILNEELVPKVLTNPSENKAELIAKFNKWFSDRIMAMKRNNEVSIIDEIIFKPHPEYINKDDNAVIFEQAKKVSFMSISDKYWISLQGIKISSEDFERKIEKLKEKLIGTNSLGSLFFSKNSSLLDVPDKIKVNSNLSLLDDFNYCLGGVTNKRWSLEGNNMYLYKQKNQKYMQEPINEYLATVMLDRFNLPDFDYVKYEMAVNGFSLCSKCKNFIKPYEEFIPMSEIMYECERKNNDIFIHTVNCLNAVGIENGQHFIDMMIIVDRKMLNFDRHLGNFGVIRDLQSGKITKMAPLFDMGGCFFSGYNPSEIRVKDNKKKKILFNERAKELENQSKMLDYTNDLLNEIKMLLGEYTYSDEEKINEIIEKIDSPKEQKNEDIERASSPVFVF